MGKKFNDIKSGTICTLVHNDSLIFRITHINEVGYPFAKYSMYCYSTCDEFEFQIDDKPVCMAYTTEYKEATKEQKEKFIKAEAKEIYKKTENNSENIYDNNCSAHITVE